MSSSEASRSSSAPTWLIGRARIARSTALRVARSRARTVHQSAESRIAMVRRQLVAGALVTVALAAGVAAAPVAASLGPRTALRQGVDPVLFLAASAEPARWLPPQLHRRGLQRRAVLDLGHRRRQPDQDRDPRHLRRADIPCGRLGDRRAILETAGPAGRARGDHDPWRLYGRLGPLVDSAGGAPRFNGQRAEKLADAYYASASLDAGVVVTSGADAGIGLLPGDTYTVGASVSVADAAPWARATGRIPSSARTTTRDWPNG